MAKPYQYPSSNQSFSQTVTSVASSNGLKNANSITPGQTITLPDGSSVTAQKGDTLGGIVDKWKTNAATQAQPTLVIQIL
jgi:LysM repeat protein